MERRTGDRGPRLRRPVAGTQGQGLRVLDRPQLRLRADREDRPGRGRPPGAGHVLQAVRGLALTVLAALPEGDHRLAGRLQRRGAHHPEEHRRALRPARRQQGQGHRHPGPQPALVGRQGQAGHPRLPGGRRRGPHPGARRRHGGRRRHRRVHRRPHHARPPRPGQQRPAARPRPGLRDHARRGPALLGPGARFRRGGRGDRAGRPGEEPQGRRRVHGRTEGPA